MWLSSLLVMVTLFTLSVEPSKCPSYINDHIEALLQDPKSLSLPLGRAFVANTFNRALVLDSIHYKVGTVKRSFTNVHHTPVIIEVPSHESAILTLTVMPCMLSIPKHKSSVDFQLCKVSLYARVYGSEIYAGEASGQSTDDGSSCFWDLSFHLPLGLADGDFSIEILTMWINENQEPESSVRERSKDSRINDGNVIHLGGMGTHPYHAVNATNKFHNFTGYLLQGNTRTVHLIVENTKRPFTSFGDLLDLGYEGIPIQRVPDTFLNLFEDGKDIIPSEKYLHAKNMCTGEILQSAFSKDIIQRINDKVVLTIVDSSRNEALVFGLPGKISVISSHNYTSESQNATCDTLSYVPAGRWVFESTCSGFGKNGDASVEDIPIGHKCQQSLPVYAKGMPLFFHNRLRSMVWKPYYCVLTYFPMSVTYDKRTQSIQPEGGEYTIHSSLGYYLRRAGIGAIAGFGDSLGDEQRDNVLSLLGGYEWSPGYGVCCQNNKNKIHKLHLSSNEESGLVSCIRDVSLGINKSFPLFPKTTSPLFTHPVTPSSAEESIVPVREIVLFTNFMSQHSVWIMTLKEIEDSLHEQAKQHKHLADLLLKERGYNYRRIFFASTAVHGFRTGGLTPGRQRWLNDKARDILGSEGWEIFDSYNITLSRPDATNDGVHYRGGVSITLTDLFLNALINKPSTDQHSVPKNEAVTLNNEKVKTIEESVNYKKLYEESIRELDELERRAKNKATDHNKFRA